MTTVCNLFAVACVADTLSYRQKLMHNIMLQARRAAKTYVGVSHLLVSYAVCDLFRNLLKSVDTHHS